MLFNSYTFLGLFLPVVLVVYHVLARRSFPRALAWLTLASLAFYAWWNPRPDEPWSPF